MNFCFGVDDDREIVKSHLFTQGILSTIRRVAVTMPDDTYGVIVKDTPDLEVDRVSLNFNRENWDWFKDLYAIVGEEYNQPHKIEDALAIMTRSGMKMAVISLAYNVHRNIWQGDITKNKPDFKTRYPKGLQFQIDNVYEKDDLNVSNLIPHLEMVEAQLFAASYQMGLHPVEWIIVTDPILGGRLLQHKEQFVNDRLWLNRHPYQLIDDAGIEFTINDRKDKLLLPVYFIPVSTKDPEQGTFYYFADAKLAINEHLNQDAFWTDAGLYVWVTHRCKWDFKLSVWHTYKPILTVPELAAVIPNVLVLPPEKI